MIKLPPLRLMLCCFACFFLWATPAQADTYTYNAQVLRCYDADTCTVSIDLGMSIVIKKTIRLFGINAPELRGKERAKGIRSRDYMISRVVGKRVIIKTEKDKSGKYGRLLGTLFLSGININKELVDKGLAVYKDYQHQKKYLDNAFIYPQY